MNYIIIGIFALLAYFFGREILSLFLTDIPTLNMAYKTAGDHFMELPHLSAMPTSLAGIMRASGVVFWPTLTRYFLHLGSKRYRWHTSCTPESVLRGSCSAFRQAFITMPHSPVLLFTHFFWKDRKEHARLV